VPLLRERPDLGEPIEGAEQYLRVEAYYAASHEGALHLDDVLARRLRVSIEMRDRGARAAESVGALVGEALGWDGATAAREIADYRRQVEAELASEQQPDDAAADAARRTVGDPRLVAGRG
jgi:glycerol-3-phosphate dehydrogenase